MKNKFYITTSIPYVNAKPHIGFALELVQADAIARYQALKGKEVFFLTGVDEHGKKIMEAAEKNGKTPRAFVNEISKEFKRLTQLLNLRHDDFIRTTDQQKHWPAVEKVWLKLEASGDIYKKEYQGLYCVGCEAFITKKDLKAGKCIIHKKKPELVEEENYFFRLSKYSKKIETLIKEDKIKIIPQERKREMLSFLKQGLVDLSFSRPRKDLKWAIPVPGDSSASIYIWADALTNYLSGVNYAAEDVQFKKFWPAEVHCIGKDIQKFHCLIWPGMLLSLGLALPKAVLVHGFITVAGQKMSKSLGNVVDPIELINKYGADAVRYFLLREIPTTQDGDFTYEKFIQRYNADLAKGLGNLVARLITLADKYKVVCAEKVKDLRIKKELALVHKQYQAALDEYNLYEALVVLWRLIGFYDKLIEREKLWEGNKQELIGDLLLGLKDLAEKLKPFLPDTAVAILKQVETKKSKALFPRLV